MTWNRVLRLAVLWVVVGLYISSIGFLYGQEGRGRGLMRGIVTDEDGQNIANASVQVFWHQNKNVVFNIKTNDKGKFSVNGLAGGNWEIFVSAEGYLDAQKMSSIQQVPDNPVINIIMKKKTAENTTKIVQNNLDKNASLIDQGKQLFNEGKFDEALDIFQQFSEKQPEFYQTHMLIGNCYKETGELEQALSAYQKALSLAPADNTDKTFMSQIEAAIGDLYIRKNDLKTAQDHFKKSLEYSPTDEILAYNVGEIFFSNNKTDEALMYFKLASSIKPQWSQPFLKLGYVYLNAGDYPNAKTSFQKFLELDPENAEASTVKEVLDSLK